ncbi:beta-L-arabinofuranosidase domain-containing protein [Saccharicrinis sp. FJH62]|uniref:beta-L-arabinofuranosidase domain-containing protein n=1 Tax=Saccharicrinis sp. FJH62 TaxID=3344657 RepID=UPI0035D4B4D4
MLKTLMILFAYTGLTANAQTLVNVAPNVSSVTASYTAAWNNLNAVNNQTAGFGLAGGGLPALGNSETWGSWSNTRPASQWLSYEWSDSVSVNKVSVYFWCDNAGSTAGDGVAMPSSWKIQYMNSSSSEWQDVTLSDGQAYPLNIASVNAVEFEPVKTKTLRLFLNASTDGTSYAALGVTEWEVYSEFADPSVLVNASKIVLSDVRGKSTATLNVKGINIPEEGIDVAFKNGLSGVELSAAHISQLEAQSVGGYNLTMTFNSVEGTSAFDTLTFLTGSTHKDIVVNTSRDNDCFQEKVLNLIYDPRFLTMDRYSTWSNPPTLVTLSDGEDIKCGATCLKLNGTSGIESPNMYFDAVEYKLSGWIKTNGTFETGIYGNGGVFTSTDDATVEQARDYIYFLIPDTEGEWQFFEHTFSVANPVGGGAWVNNGHNETATTVYLDNWQIYDASDSLSSDTGGTHEYHDYPIEPVSFTEVKLNDAFWSPRILQNQETTIPIALNQCYITGRVDNFKKAGGLMPGYFSTEYTFDDTDIYKILEGMSYSIQSLPNKELEKQMDTLIYYIEKAQEEDGYLYTARTAGEPGNLHDWVGAQRWEKDPDLSHELYNCGHLYEAAVAHYNATGKRSLLDIAIKSADLLVKDFLVGGLTYEPGHQIVEMGLVKLYRVTGNKDYLELAKYFLDLRGTKGVMRKEYSQSHLPVVKQTEAVGHAVRAVYMYSGMADVAALTNNPSYLHAIDTIWGNVVDKKYYITGGIGAKHDGEAFDHNYVLPNKEAYCETCAAIGNVYWNHRMFLMHGQSKYYDVIERTLYNGIISGISLSGNLFFYPNPLESDGEYLFNQGANTRKEWFGCACCPSNLCRFVPSMPGYIYAQKSDSIYVNLYVQGESTISLNEDTVRITQVTNYPWEGNVSLTVNPETSKAFSLLLRVPGWAKNNPVPGELYRYLDATVNNITLSVNDEPVEYELNADGYIVLTRTWTSDDVIQINFPMDVHRTVANELVEEDAGKVSLERGPIVYTLEWPDNGGHVLNSVIEDNNQITAVSEPEWMNGVVSLQIDGKIATADRETNTIVLQDKKLKAIPYYAWSNRGPGEMAVWIARSSAHAEATPATDTLVYDVRVKPEYGPDNTVYPFNTVVINDQLLNDAFGLSTAELRSSFGSTLKYAALSPAGTLNTNSTATNPGHWFDPDGYVTNWNSNSVVFSEFDISNLSFKIGLFPGLSDEGDTYTVSQALTYSTGTMARRVVFKFDVMVTNATGIDTDKRPEEQTALIYSAGDQLVVTNILSDTGIRIHDISGRQFFNRLAGAARFTIKLPSGIYIVTAGNTRQKVLIVGK